MLVSFHYWKITALKDSDNDSYLHIPLSQIKNEERMV